MSRKKRVSSRTWVEQDDGAFRSSDGWIVQKLRHSGFYAEDAWQWVAGRVGGGGLKKSKTCYGHGGWILYKSADRAIAAVESKFPSYL